MAIVLVLAGGVGIIQVAFIITTIQKACPGLNKYSAVRQAIRIVQVSPFVLMIASAIWLFFLVFLPVKLENPYSSKEGLFLIITASYLWLNVTFNYFAAMLKSPGYPLTVSEMEESGLSPEVDSILCYKCDRVKASDTHHCATCRSCVTMMCHHCPFTNNCVGLKNYSYFYLFICFSNVGLLFSLYMTYDPFYHCMVYNGEHLSLLPWYPPGICTQLGDFAVIFIPVAFMAMFGGAMFVLQTLLLLTDFSTIDLLTKLQRSPNLWHFGRLILDRMVKHKKRRFKVMFWYSRERWWQFLVPSFNVPSRHLETIKLMV
ncbi:palmitoyltransferase ZDHHC3-like [Dendronephthya gigantea]|uniref:palmitoyltransferase ZDHHC3-like n=1 Tax=Dendronephthya gigantea TaxID=151771 RepID=UPI00106AD13D|nr:palmitoyltransferase ZDHHC3-like [Dendronephthya gigantea]